MTVTQFPLISIVTPSYNQGQFIEETIQSVFRQDYPHIEHIVIDGGSTDGTLDILRRYDSHIVWVSESDQGQADAINKGLHLASGKILAYLNSDDKYLPGTLQTVAETFTSHPDVGLVYGDCLAVDVDGTVRGTIKGHSFSLDRMIMRGEFVPQQAAFWSRPAMEQVGFFDPELQFCMDHDFFIRVGQYFPCLYLPKPLAKFRFHGTSKSVSHEEQHWRESLLVSERYGMKPWTIWFWIRRMRHYGLRMLPDFLELFIRRRVLRRPHDPVQYSGPTDPSS